MEVSRNGVPKMFKTCLLPITLFCSGCITVRGDITVQSPYADCRIMVENDRLAIVPFRQYAKINPSDTFERLPPIKENDDGSQN
jgi:hypothetical protein